MQKFQVPGEKKVELVEVLPKFLEVLKREKEISVTAHTVINQTLSIILITVFPDV